MLYIEPSAFFFGAFLLLMLPLKWLLAAFLAAAIHELCHMAAVVYLGGTVSRICIGPEGAGIDASLPGRKEELLAILAGPTGSLLLLSLVRWLPEVAVCGCVQGVYNLLPVRSLDGGRALAVLLEGTKHGRWVLAVAETLTYAGVIYAVWYSKTGFWLAPAVLIHLAKRIRIKIPCKRRKFAVQ